MGVVLRLRALFGRTLVISALAVGVIPHSALAMPTQSEPGIENRLSSALVTGSVAGLGNDNIPGEPMPAVSTDYSFPKFTPSQSYTGLPPVDVYSINLTEGDLLAVSLAIPDNCYFEMYLFPPGSTNVWTNTYTTTSYTPTSYRQVNLRTRASQTGTYYLAVINYWSGWNGTYRLGHYIHQLSGDDDIPGAIVPGPEETFSIGSLNWMSDWSDVYAFEIEEDEEYVFELEFPGRPGSSAMWSYQPGSTNAWGDYPAEYTLVTAQDMSRLKYHCPPGGAGTFYLEVSTASQTGSYYLTWERSKPRVASVANSDRYTTSYSISRANFSSADSVVLATGTSYADALAASSLAGMLRAPLLLAPSASQSLQTRALSWELGRLGVRDCYIVGGDGAIKPAFENWLRSIGYSTHRIAGKDRYETAAKVAEHVIANAATAPSTAFVVRGDGYPDALSCAPYAYSQGIPILLTRPTALAAPTRSLLDKHDIRDVVIAGGAAAVSSGVKGNIASLNGGTTVTRIAGTTRYSTCTKMAEYAVKTRGWGSYAFTGIAVGTSFPDALSGGAAAGSRGGVLLLNRQGRISDDLWNTVVKRGSEMQRVQCFGGQLVNFEISLGYHLP